MISYIKAPSHADAPIYRLPYRGSRRKGPIQTLPVWRLWYKSFPKGGPGNLPKLDLVEALKQSFPIRRPLTLEQVFFKVKEGGGLCEHLSTRSFRFHMSPRTTPYNIFHLVLFYGFDIFKISSSCDSNCASSFVDCILVLKVFLWNSSFKLVKCFRECRNGSNLLICRFSHLQWFPYVYCNDSGVLAGSQRSILLILFRFYICFMKTSFGALGL